jgi:hypothetical protein
VSEGMEAALCSCDVMFDDLPYPEFVRERHPVAAKEHRCCECGDMIRVGERYQYITGKWDGDFVSFKTCSVCECIRGDYCAPFTMLDETLREYLGIGLNEVPDE